METSRHFLAASQRVAKQNHPSSATDSAANHNVTFEFAQRNKSVRVSDSSPELGSREELRQVSQRWGEVGCESWKTQAEVSLQTS